MKHLIHLMAAKTVENLAGAACIADAGKTAAVVVVAACSFDSSVVAVAAAGEADTVVVVDTGIAGVVPDGQSAEQEVEFQVEMVVCIVDAQIGEAARYAEPGHDFHKRRKRVSEVIQLAERVALA
jgi:hypothetical protein